jgi:hypothetical protein
VTLPSGFGLRAKTDRIQLHFRMGAGCGGGTISLIRVM